MRDHDRLQAAGSAEAAQDLADVDLDCACGDIEPPSNGFVRQAFAQERQDLALARGKMNSARLASFVVVAGGRHAHGTSGEGSLYLFDVKRNDPGCNRSNFHLSPLGSLKYGTTVFRGELAESA